MRVPTILISWDSVHKTILQSAECIFLTVEIATYDPRNSQKWCIIIVPADGCEITVFGLNKRCSENRPLVLDIVQMTSTYSSNLISWNQNCGYSHRFVTVSWLISHSHRCMRSSYIFLLKLTNNLIWVLIVIGSVGLWLQSRVVLLLEKYSLNIPYLNISSTSTGCFHISMFAWDSILTSISTFFL